MKSQLADSLEKEVLLEKQLNEKQVALNLLSKQLDTIKFTHNDKEK